MINEELKINIENFEFDFASINFHYKANEKYLGVALNLMKDTIYFYNLNKRKDIKNEYFELKIDFILFELNQKYPNVLAISNKCFIELYELPDSFNKSEIRLIPKIKYKVNNFIYDISFNPRYSHIIAIIFRGNYLHIWNNQTIYNNCNFSFNGHLEFFKWEKDGKLCAICEKKQ